MKRHIIAISGGKDSTAMALRLKELNPDIDYDYIITPTGDELPEMVDHWARLERILGKSFIRLTTPENSTLHTLICEHKMLPNHRARWCTITLKIEPVIDYFKTLPSGSVQYVGLRADEPERKGLYGDDILVKFPMREWGWGLTDVMNYLNEKGICIPKRTDCARCYAQRLTEWHALWRDQPEIFDHAEQQEMWVSEYRQKPCSFRSPSRDLWPAQLKDLRKEFENGRIPRGQKKYDERDTCRICRL